MAAYVNKYAQPIDFYNVRRSVELLWRTATQGDRELRQLGDFSRFLPELLNPSLEGYFQALTERNRFIADLDAALDPWDVWICPVAATSAFTHRPAWSAIDVDGRSYPHVVANGAYAMPFNLSGHPSSYTNRANSGRITAWNPTYRQAVARNGATLDRAIDR
jgi:amidase